MKLHSASGNLPKTYRRCNSRGDNFTIGRNCDSAHWIAAGVVQHDPQLIRFPNVHCAALRARRNYQAIAKLCNCHTIYRMATDAPQNARRHCVECLAREFFSALRFFGGNLAAKARKKMQNSLFKTPLVRISPRSIASSANTRRLRAKFAAPAHRARCALARLAPFCCQTTHEPFSGAP